MKSVLLVLAGLLTSGAVFGADQACVIPGQGYFRIHVGAAGLFGSFAHDHLVEAQQIEGCASIDSNDVLNSSIKLTFAAAKLRVIDPNEGEKDRATVQKTMETDVLNVSAYPEVKFESTSIERGDAPDRFRVHGKLTIRGKAQPALIPVTLSRQANGTYKAAGEYRFKQSSFLIRPIQLAGGTIKVKDELQTEFELFLK